VLALGVALSEDGRDGIGEGTAEAMERRRPLRSEATFAALSTES